MDLLDSAFVVGQFVPACCCSCVAIDDASAHAHTDLHLRARESINIFDRYALIAFRLHTIFDLPFTGYLRVAIYD